MRSDAFKAKMNAGPVAIMTIMPNGPMSVGRSMGLWFAFTLVVGGFAAYIACATLAPGTAYLRVFQIAGAVAYACYGMAMWSNSIWYGRSWMTTLRFNIDALLYGCLTGGMFGWLWPHGQ
jgi:hypothetical protein